MSQVSTKAPPAPPRPQPRAVTAPPPPKPNPPVPLDRYVELGDPVYWYPGADPAVVPMTGIVTGIGVGTVDCNVFTTALHNTVPQEGAMHMDHPDARTDKNSGGGWRHRPLDLAVRKMLFAAGILRWNGKDRYDVSPDFAFHDFAKQVYGDPSAMKTPAMKTPATDPPPA